MAVEKIKNISVDMSNLSNFNNSVPNVHFGQVPKIDNSNNIDYIASFGDKVLDFFGSNNITKGTAIEILEMENLDFIDKDDIKEALRCGVNGENVKIILDTGEEYLFVPDGDSFKLSSYTNSLGEICSFDNGIDSLLDNIYGGNGVGTTHSIKDISVFGDTLMIETADDLKVYFDKNTFEIKSFGLNGNTYNYSDLENALNTIMESKIAAINERIAYLGDNHPIVPGLKEDIERVKEQYSAGNITEITVEDGYIAFKLDDNPRPIYVNYDGSTVSSIEYYTGGGPYINGYSHIDV